MNFLKKIIYLSLILVVPNFVFAQGGSNYSLFGVGDIVSTGASYEGMAGTSIAVPLDKSINLTNPAMWANNTDTRIQLGYRFNQNFVSNSNTSLMQNNGKIDGILALFVIDTSMGLTLGGGLNNYSNLNFHISTPVSYEFDGLRVTGKSIYQGTGGISNAYIGSSIKIIDEVAIGLTYKAFFGLSNENSTQIYNETYAFTTITEKEDNYSGSAFRLGLNINPMENLHIGAFYETSANIDVKSNTYYPTIFGNDTTIASKSNFDLPSHLGFGASYRSGKFLFALDFSTQDFSDLTYKKRETVTFKSANNFSIGVRRFGNKSWSADFFDKVTYSAGFGFKNLYYTLNNTDISEMFVSYGMQFPLPETAVIDASVVLGNRGTTDAGLVNEFFTRLNFNISIGETWFKPFAREWD